MSLTGATAMAAGAAHSCALVAGGVACWGDNHRGQLGTGFVTVETTPAIVVGIGGAAGASRTRTAGGAASSETSPAPVGDGPAVTDAPEDSPDASAVAASAASFSPPVDPIPILPAVSVPGAVAVAAGTSHACALLSDATVRCWGSNVSGQLGDGTRTPRGTPVTVKALTGVRSIVAGGVHTCARMANGTVRCWGDNSLRQLGDGTTTSRATPVTVRSLAHVTAISAGWSHTCARISDGTVRCWGSNRTGELGDGTTLTRSSPVAVKGLTAVRSIAVGGAHACALRADETVRCWGRNMLGGLGDGTTVDRRTPVAVTGLSGVAAIYTGDFHSCARLAGGAVRCWGGNFAGQLGDYTTTDQYRPIEIPGLAGATLDLVPSVAHVRRPVGRQRLLLGLQRERPARDRHGRGRAPARPGAGSHECQIDRDRATPSPARSSPTAPPGAGARTGRASSGRVPLRALAPVAVRVTEPVTSVSTSLANAARFPDPRASSTMAATSPCWGPTDDDGEYVFDFTGTPTTVDGIASAASVAALACRTACALRRRWRRSGCWGRNLEGQLGDGTGTASPAPVAAAGITDATAITVGTLSHVRPPGGRDGGVLGVQRGWSARRRHDDEPKRPDRRAGTDGRHGDRRRPEAHLRSSLRPHGLVLGLEPARAARRRDGDPAHGPDAGRDADGHRVDLGGHRPHLRLGLDGHGAVLGRQRIGAAGRWHPDRAPRAGLRAGLRGVASVAAGDRQTCALLTDHSVRCWGANEAGQLGDGTATGRLAPVTVRTLVDAIAVAAGADRTCAIRSTGVAACWGSNQYGQLGIGREPRQTTPIRVYGIGPAVP